MEVNICTNCEHFCLLGTEYAGVSRTECCADIERNKVTGEVIPQDPYEIRARVGSYCPFWKKRETICEKLNKFWNNVKIQLFKLARN